MTTRPLSKDFYSFIIFFLSIVCIVVVIQATALLNVGFKVLSMNSFFPWLWLVIGVMLVTNITLISYFLHQGYRAAAIMCGISMIPALFQYAMITNIELRVASQQYYSTNAYTLFLTTALFGLVLAFSSGNKQWMRLSGILTAIFASMQAVLFYFYFHTGDAGTKLLIERTSRWATLCEVISPVSLLIHFVCENIPRASETGGIYRADVFGFQFLRGSPGPREAV
jgi:hypothetical protein